MDAVRERKLKKNFFKIFYINALLNVKMVNVVLSLLYIHRNLDITDIFYLGIVYSITVIASEVPSSYAADLFGRKKTVIMAACFGVLHWIFFLISHNFFIFAVGVVFYALAESFMSGTDEALVYDTNRELGTHGQAFHK